MTQTIRNDCASVSAAALAERPGAGPWRVPPEASEGADEYLSRLVDAGEHEQAVRFSSIRLDPRAAVWWGALAVWAVQREADPAPDPSNAADAAIDAAVAWVLDASEDNRRMANAAGGRAGLDTAAGALATAAFWAEGSVSLPDQPHVAPPAGVSQKMVANAVLMAHTPNRSLVAALRLAAEVLAGANLWPEATPLSNAGSR